MTYIILFVVFVFAGALFQVNHKKKHQYDIASFSIEAPNRIRIYNESMHILETTNVAKTFIGRVRDVVAFQDWAAIQVRKGMPLKVSGNILSARRDCYEFINRNALRVALAEFALFSKEDRTSGTKIDKAAARAFESVDGLMLCLKTAENQGEIKSELENIRNLVEDIYSNI